MTIIVRTQDCILVTVTGGTDMWPVQARTVLPLTFSGYICAIIGICYRLQTYNSDSTLLVHPVLFHDRYSYKNHDKIYPVFPVASSARLNLTGGIIALIYPIVEGLILVYLLHLLLNCHIHLVTKFLKTLLQTMLLCYDNPDDVCI